MEKSDDAGVQAGEGFFLLVRPKGGINVTV